jgi:DNA-binding IclR family transcriptional regulator
MAYSSDEHTASEASAYRTDEQSSESSEGSAGGLQVVAKVVLLLRALSSSGAQGLTTSSAARETGLTRPTAHRLLTSLLEQGLADRDHNTSRWQLGPEIYLLGSVAALRYDITEYARDVLTYLSTETGESAFLSAARGSETVCLLQEDGSFPLRSHVLYEGIRFPLGVASAGLAILAHLPAREADAYMATSDLIPQWGRAHSRRALKARVAATRESGYAINPGLVVEGSWGMGAAVFDRAGRPAWALSLTGVESRFREPRSAKLGRLLLSQAHILTQRLRVVSSPVDGPA